jgi:hypothetical protein
MSAQDDDRDGSIAARNVECNVAAPKRMKVGGNPVIYRAVPVGPRDRGSLCTRIADDAIDLVSRWRNLMLGAG